MWGVCVGGGAKKPLFIKYKILVDSFINWASAQECHTLLHVNNKGAELSAHQRSLISTIVIRSLESVIATLAI